MRFKSWNYLRAVDSSSIAVLPTNWDLALAAETKPAEALTSLLIILPSVPLCARCWTSSASNKQHVRTGSADNRKDDNNKQHVRPGGAAALHVSWRDVSVELTSARRVLRGARLRSLRRCLEHRCHFSVRRWRDGVHLCSQAFAQVFLLWQLSITSTRVLTAVRRNALSAKQHAQSPPTTSWSRSSPSGLCRKDNGPRATEF